MLSKRLQDLLTLATAPSAAHGERANAALAFAQLYAKQAQSEPEAASPRPAVEPAPSFPLEMHLQHLNEKASLKSRIDHLEMLLADSYKENRNLWEEIARLEQRGAA